MNNGSINNLWKLLEPSLPDKFLKNIWGKTYLHVSGWRGKFAHLLPWDRLNEILGQHRLDFPRLRLALDGKSLPASSYLRYARNARQRSPIPRLLSTELTKHLREGATLVLDAVDELHRPLRELAEGLEYFFRERVQVNAYAGWQTTRGFDLHYDDHDVFILQVTGRKLWKVYGMTKPHPTAQDRAGIDKPAGAPLWEGMMTDGDLLYIPRGWWHVAIPQAEATLHLTVGVHNRTGLDLLRWLTGKMSESAIFRQDLPRFSSDAEQQAHMMKLRDEVLGLWDESLLKRYFDDYDALAEPRPSLNFPSSVTDGANALRDDSRVRLTATRPLNFVIEDGIIEFACNKKRWQFAAEAIVILRTLEERRVCSVSELCRAASGKLDSETVRAFMGELLFHGLVTHAGSES